MHKSVVKLIISYVSVSKAKIPLTWYAEAACVMRYQTKMEICE